MKISFHNNRDPRRRRGATLIVAVFFLAVMLAFMAMVVDLGYLANAGAELQRSADSAAMAACWDYAEKLSVGSPHQCAAATGHSSAGSAAGENQVCNTAPAISTTDVTWGRLNNFYDRQEALDTSDSGTYNAVRVSVRRTASMNGRVPVFFAKVFGLEGIDAHRSATAAIVRDVVGFQTPSDCSNIDILPFALDKDTWIDMCQNVVGSDDWKWDKDAKSITSGGDGLREFNLYPQGTGSPGNRGTVDIGSSNNSTNDLARQIVDGISPEDMEHVGNSLEFDENGELFLNGDTGISAGMKDELASIKGQPRLIPIFEEVNGPGNNAEYTIVAWHGVRILDVKLTGSKSSKRVTVQAAPMCVKGVIPGPPSATQSNIFSPVVLVR